MTSEVEAKVCLTVLIVLMLILFSDVEICWAQPSAQTLPATNITATSAVLHGVVTTNNKDTLWVFGYVQGYYNPLPPTWLDSCPSGDSSNWGFVPAGAGTQPASCQVTGLQPSTTYSFALADCWASDCASVVGSTLSFTTLPAAAPFDFTLWVSPSTVSVKQGDAANYQISITHSDPSYSGTTITVQVSGLGPGMNYEIIPTPPGLRVSTSQSTPTGTYTITLAGSANGVMHETSAILIVQQVMARYTIDWALSNPSLSPPSPKVGDQVTFNVIASQHSSDWPDSLSVSLNVKLDGAPFDFLWIYQNQPGPIPPGTTMTATTKPWTATAGTHSVTWTLVFFGGNESVILTDPTENNEASLEFSVAVQAPDFRIDASPLAQTVTQRQTTSYSVNVVRLYGFNSQVSLSVSGLPAGTTGIFSVQSSTPDYSSTLTVTIPGNSPTGSFTLTISGSGGGITRTANVYWQSTHPRR